MDLQTLLCHHPGAPQSWGLPLHKLPYSDVRNSGPLEVLGLEQQPAFVKTSWVPNPKFAFHASFPIPTASQTGQSPYHQQGNQGLERFHNLPRWEAKTREKGSNSHSGMSPQATLQRFQMGFLNFSFLNLWDFAGYSSQIIDKFIIPAKADVNKPFSFLFSVFQKMNMHSYSIYISTLHLPVILANSDRKVNTKMKIIFIKQLLW